MDLSIYFEPIKVESLCSTKFGAQISSYRQENDFPDFKKSKLVLFGINDNALGADGQEIRSYLYHLAQIENIDNVVDLGNLIGAENPKDTTFAIVEIITHLVKLNKQIVIIHGNRMYSHSIYSAFSNLEQLINLAVVDQHIHIGNNSDELNKDNYLSKIMLSKNNCLFHFAQIGHQAHFTGPEQLALMDRLHFDHLRLGEIRTDITIAEPVFRNTDVSIFNLSAVRMSDAPGSEEAGPNGLFGEEYCRLARYAGISDKNNVAAFFEYSKKYDKRGVSAHLQAQAIWYYMEGLSLRKGDFPIGTKENYLKYTVDIETGEAMVFFKSDKSDRWWVTIPVPAGNDLRYMRHHLVPCTYRDYQKACNNEIPDVWLKSLQKLS